MARTADTNAQIITIGGTTVSGGTVGSVLFVGASGFLQQDNANFFWDDTNNRLLIGTNTGIAIATGGNFQVVTPAIASTAEVLSTWRVSDDAVSSLTIENFSASNNAFLPQIRGTGPTTNVAFHLVGQGTTDTGTNALVAIVGRIGASTTVATRPLFEVRNSAARRYSITANGQHVLIPSATTSGVVADWALAPAANTGITASTESNVFRIDTATRTWATTGTVATQRDVMLNGMTYDSASASQTFTIGSTLFASSPIAGANAIITGSYACWFQANAIASTAEKIALFSVSDDSVGKLEIVNASAGAGRFDPSILSTGNGANGALTLFGAATTDTGTVPVMTFDSRTAAAAAITVRPLFQWRNFGTAIQIIDFRGRHALTPVASTTGVIADWVLTPGADTGITASTESNVIRMDTATRTWATTGTVASQRDVMFNGITYASASASQTFTRAATLYASSPIAGSNAVITAGYAAWFEATAITSGIESIALFTVSDNSTSKLEIKNVSSTDGIFQPEIFAVESSTGPVLRFTLQGTTDTGSNALLYTNIRIGASTAVATRPMVRIDNNGTAVSTLTAFGKQAHTPIASSTLGNTTSFNWVIPADTARTSESFGFKFDGSSTQTWSNGSAPSTQRNAVFLAPTYAFTVGANTIATAATVAIDNAPQAGTNAVYTTVTALLLGGTASTLGATSAGFNYSVLKAPDHTVTVTGSTQVTSACGASMMNLGIATITDASAVTIDAASTLYIAGAVAQAGSVTITKKYSLWIDAGLPRIDSVSANSTTACVLTAASGPAGANTAVQEWLTIDINGTTRYIPCW